MTARYYEQRRRVRKLEAMQNYFPVELRRKHGLDEAAVRALVADIDEEYNRRYVVRKTQAKQARVASASGAKSVGAPPTPRSALSALPN